MDRLASSSPRCLWRAPGAAPIAVFAEGSIRSLVFGHGTVQSRVDLDAPHRLQLPYTRSLAAALLLAPEPRTALLLGLGGGALAHFLLHQVAGITVTGVDSSADVIDAARRHFALPATPALRIEQSDARDAVREPGPPHDLVVVDLFDAHGLPAWVCESAFLAEARTAVRPGGVLAMNLWMDAADEFLDMMRGARDAFDGRVLALGVPGYRNLVVFALPGGPRRLALADLRGRARALTARTGIDFEVILRTLAASNLTTGGDLVLVADGARRRPGSSGPAGSNE